MSTWINADPNMKIIESQLTRRDGWHKVKPTLNGRILTDDGIAMYLWDGAESVIKRDDQSIARERRERRND